MFDAPASSIRGLDTLRGCLSSHVAAIPRPVGTWPPPCSASAKTKPLGALGRLEHWHCRSVWSSGRFPQACSSRTCWCSPKSRGGKAGVGLSGLTWQMVESTAGGAAINVFARQMGIALSVVDAGVAHDFGEAHTGLVACRSPARNYLEAPAMDAAQRDLAMWLAGRRWPAGARAAR